LIIRAKFQVAEKLLDGYVTNLSETGAFLATEELAEVGEPVGLILDMPWMLGEVTAEAEVVWQTDAAGKGADRLPTGMGLLFVNVSADGKRKIRQYIQKFCQLATQIGQHAV
jgi:uncharacterized protein (TIGR02266 family)